MDYSRPDLADRLAADYVSGTLRGPARRRFEALLPAHPLLRAAVREWQARLMPLTLSITPEAPPAAVWKRIEARIGAAPAPAGAAPASWWSQLALWRGVSAFAMAAVVGLAVLLTNPGPAQPPVVVVLSATGSTDGAVPASFVASISGDGRAMVTRPLVNVSLEASRALELWALPASGAPRSLGLISARDATVVKKGKVLAGATALAVSLEPAGGSPTGAPTGPVLFVGKLQL
ncbi:anti-sigma factor domain-containing protein [Piscinibacter sp.]|jgi:anti-sigma-K factor RskA|uniref:anti-sigma factor n=1 Tax=Piscinibacter sp. TaxID=1903157 RepID=UPI0035594AA9